MLRNNDFSSIYEEFKTFYPVFYQNVFEMDSLWKTTGNKLDILMSDIDKVVSNNFISTADEKTVSALEKFLYIPPQKATLDERRRLVKSLFQGSYRIGQNEIKNIVGQFTNGEISVVLVDGCVEIWVLRNETDVLSFTSSLFVLKRKMPAHLGVRLYDKAYPIVIKNIQACNIHRISFRLRSSYYDVATLFDGRHYLDGSFLLDSAPNKGIELERLTLSTSISNNSNIKSTVILAFPSIKNINTLKTATQCKVYTANIQNLDAKTEIRVSAKNSYSISATISMDSIWTFDGTYSLDGERRLNSDEIRSEI